MLGADQSRRSLSLSSSRRHFHYPPFDSDRLIQKIRSQLEYYWSDANVSRDKFFSERLSRDADCWVTLGELRSFPILRRLRVSESQILAAAKSSSFLVVDEFSRIDRNWREYPPRLAIDNLANLQTDVDRTVYIENIPLSVDREELTRLFGSGDVQHISIPRHPRTGERLGHCFAELSTADQARECVRKLQRTWPEHWQPRRDGKKLRLMSYKRWAALRDETKQYRSRSTGYSYSPAIEAMLGPAPINLEESDSSDHSGDDSDVVDVLDFEGSFAETSLAERRRKNHGTVRPNSLIRLTGIPPTDITKLRIWLGHFAVSIQYLDYADNNDTAIVRFAHRRARDFFLKDYAISNLAISGVIPTAEALSQLEFDDYFEAVREKRRENIRVNEGLPTPTGKEYTARPNQSAQRRTVLAIRKGWSKKARSTSAGAAWTDVVAGNANWAAPSSSEAYHIPFNRLAITKETSPSSGSRSEYSHNDAYSPF